MDEKEVNIFKGVILVCIIIFILLVAFIITYIKQNKKFNSDKLLAEVRGSELERKKISSDLHDELGPVLAATKIYVNALSKRDEKDVALIEKITLNLNLCLQQVRELANTLMPNTLQRNGLVKAIEEFTENIDLVVGFQIHVTFSLSELKLEREAEVNIYRIIQEIVTNTINHANCTILEIILEKKESNLQISTSDNGKGFDADKVKEVGTGCGLANIANRVSLLNGRLQLQSPINEGTKYTITIPLYKR